MGPDLFQGIFDLIDTTLGTYIIDTATNILNFVKPIFKNLIIIWIAIWGYLAMMGHTNEPLKEGVYRILRLSFILALGLTLGTYLGVTVNFLSKGPEQIAAAVTGSPPDSIGVTLDNLYIKVFEITDACFEKGGILDGNFGMYIMGFGFMILGTALLLAVAFFIISAKIMTAILLGIGPIFIALLLFKGTQRFFESWLSMVCNFGMILVLTVGLGTVALDLADAFIAKMGYPAGVWGDAATVYARGIANLDSILKLLIIFGITVLLMLQVPSIAAALGGGIALATQSIVSSTMGAMKPSSIRHMSNDVRRGLNSAQGGKAKLAAFKKTFGRSNSITGG